MRHLTLLFIVLLGLCSVAAYGQSPVYHYFRTTEPISMSQYKMVIQSVVDQDPNAQVFHSDDMRILKVRGSAAVSEAEVRTAIAQAQVTVEPGTPEMSLYLDPPAAPNALPVYVLTGDDAGDAERYRNAVAAWNQAHPDEPIELPSHVNR